MRVSWILSEVFVIMKKKQFNIKQFNIKDVQWKEKYASCPKCNHILIFGDNITKNTQDCYCINCGVKYIAIFKCENNDRRERKNK